MKRRVLFVLPADCVCHLQEVARSGLMNASRVMLKSARAHTVLEIILYTSQIMSMACSRVLLSKIFSLLSVLARNPHVKQQSICAALGAIVILFKLISL